MVIDHNDTETESLKINIEETTDNIVLNEGRSFYIERLELNFFELGCGFRIFSEIFVFYFSYSIL